MTDRTSSWSILPVQLMKWCHSFCIVSLLRSTFMHIKQTNLIWKKDTCVYKMYPSKIHITWITVVWSMLLSASSYTHLSESDSAEIVETSGHGSVIKWLFKAGSWCVPLITIGHRNMIHQHIVKCLVHRYTQCSPDRRTMDLAFLTCSTK